MQINSVQNCSYNNKSYSYPNFGWGLKEYQIKKVKNMGIFGYRNIEDKLSLVHGMKVYTGNSNVVAYCLELATKIMKNCGFTLPKSFCFAHLSHTDYGRYYKDDEVVINADYDEYTNIEELNRLAEYNASTSVGSGYFLDMYIHEFSHAAHHNNLVQNYGTKGHELFWEDLGNYKPNEMIMTPILQLYEKLLPGNNTAKNFFENESIKKLFTRADLGEYFAEVNTKKITDMLGKDCIINDLDSEFAQKYKGFPKDFDFKEEVLKNPNNALKKIIDYFNGEIWNGNIDRINDISSKLINYNT